MPNQALSQKDKDRIKYQVHRYAALHAAKADGWFEWQGRTIRWWRLYPQPVKGPFAFEWGDGVAGRAG